MKQKVLMLQNKIGSENGYTVQRFIKGRTYEISDFLLEIFILDGAVKLLDSHDDGFVEPITFSGNDEYETAALTPEKRGRGRPKKNV